MRGDAVCGWGCVEHEVKVRKVIEFEFDLEVAKPVPQILLS